MPDENNPSVVLFDASGGQGVPGSALVAGWQKSTKDTALMLRLGSGTGYNALFRGPRSVSVTKPGDAATPKGIFNFFMKSGCALAGWPAGA